MSTLPTLLSSGTYFQLEDSLGLLLSEMFAFQLVQTSPKLNPVLSSPAKRSVGYLECSQDEEIRFEGWEVWKKNGDGGRKNFFTQRWNRSQRVWADMRKMSLPFTGYLSDSYADLTSKINQLSILSDVKYMYQVLVNIERLDVWELILVVLIFQKNLDS